MRPVMDWETCSKEHVRKVEKDDGKIRSIIKMSDARLKVLRKVCVDSETASVVATDYYEVIKELLTALMLKSGLKSDNHECLISFFRMKYPSYEYEVSVIHQLKDVRNRAAYDGIFVKKDYVEMNRLEFEHIIKKLKELLRPA